MRQSIRQQAKPILMGIIENCIINSRLDATSMAIAGNELSKYRHIPALVHMHTICDIILNILSAICLLQQQ